MSIIMWMRVESRCECDSVYRDGKWVKRPGGSSVSRGAKTHVHTKVAFRGKVKESHCQAPVNNMPTSDYVLSVCVCVCGERLNKSSSGSPYRRIHNHFKVAHEDSLGERQKKLSLCSADLGGLRQVP